MLYNLGKAKPFADGLAKIIVFCGLAASLLVGCIMLAVAVRVGNAIIGW